jgi:hypothetical protein
LAQEETGMPDPLKKLRLQGFNNLTKTLSFNIYDVCYADLHSRTPSSLSDLLLKVDTRPGTGPVGPASYCIERGALIGHTAWDLLRSSIPMRRGWPGMRRLQCFELFH